MKEKNNLFPAVNFRHGFAGLVVLVAIAIVMLLMMMQMKAFFRTRPKPLIPITDINRPWLESDKILDSDQLITLPEPPKPQLSKPIQIAADVRREENPRGKITIEFATNGEVSGKWKCSYAYKDRQYSYTADFKGNIDVEETYVDRDDRSDESQLFFITRGDYTKTIANQNTGESSDTEGCVYVTGWLGPDHSAHGRITITTDETWSAVYTWNAEGK